MPQYDLLLTQNVSPSSVEFTEKYVNIGKGAILSGAADGTPTVLSAGTDGYHLVRDDNEATGLKWVAINVGHTQNTDTGTTNNTFTVDSDGVNGKLILKADNGADFTTTIQNQTQAGAIVLTLPAVTGTLATEAYADGLFAANDAMLFKGTIGSGGTHEIAAFNALTTYNAGWTYRVITAGTIRGVVCEVGDLVMVIVDRTGSGNANSDFTVAQSNLDGAVVGPASATDGNVALFNGASGKIIKDGGTLGSAAFTASTAYLPTWVSAPATKTSSGVAGQVAKDTNFIYVCTATDTWKRAVIATNW